MKVSPRDVDALIEIFEASTWDEMLLQADGFELFLSTDAAARLPGSIPSAAGIKTPAAVHGGAAVVTVGAAAAARSDAAACASPAPEHWKAVTAPNLGTFYRAPKPGAPAFVDVGQAVEAHTEMCLIEVMKLFTTVKAGVRGTLKQVCVKDAVMVGHGDVLFYIDPA